MARSLLPVAATPGQNIQSYLSFIKNIEILSPMEEQKLALKLVEEDDLNAAQALIMAHLRFVVYIARSYGGYGLPLSDLIQEGNVGLMKAVKRFDPHRGVRLITFAVYWIRAEIHEYILQNWRIVKVATTKPQRKLFFNLRSSKKRLAWMTESEISAVAKDLNVKVSEVREMENRLTAADVSFDYDDNDDDDSPKAPSTYLADNSMNPAMLAEDDEWKEKLHRALSIGISELDERSKRIVKARWLAPQKTTLQVLSKEFGVSTERVRQIEQLAFQKVRKHLKDLHDS